jgi:hypothetical protein
MLPGIYCSSDWSIGNVDNWYMLDPLPCILFALVGLRVTHREEEYVRFCFGNVINKEDFENGCWVEESY